MKEQTLKVFNKIKEISLIVGEWAVLGVSWGFVIYITLAFLDRALDYVYNHQELCIQILVGLVAAIFLGFMIERVLTTPKRWAVAGLLVFITVVGDVLYVRDLNMKESIKAEKAEEAKSLRRSKMTEAEKEADDWNIIFAPNKSQ